MKTKASILLVEDDKNLGYVLKDFLNMSGYKVDLYENGIDGLHAFKENQLRYDLCLLDVMLPYKDGFSLAEEIRKGDKLIPIIFLTAKTMQEDKIKGFKIGADDYITKPFSTEELNLRIEAILRRAQMGSLVSDKENSYKIGNFTFDYTNQVLISPDSEQRLTRKEADVLRLFCMNRNKILRREVALKAIWGDDDYFMGRSMDVYIAKLRKFLASDNNVSIVNIHRTGFKLEIKEENKESE